MSWLARSIAATLSSAPSDDDDDSEATSDDKSPEHAAHPANTDAEEDDEQTDTPSRGVKGDISELTESLTRRFWGVASFLAPPPPAEATDTAAAEGEYGAESPRVAGIRSDLAEIGGKVRNGISILSNANAVAEISKIASSFLPFVPGEEEEEEVEAVGLTEEVVVFVRHISTQPETWLDFPLFLNDRHNDDFELSDTQYEHALAIERVVPTLSYVRTELCSNNMSEACFWKIYFVLLHSKLIKHDAELLSTPQILEAREELLQSSPTTKKLGSEGAVASSENRNDPFTQAEDRELSPSSIQYKSGMTEAPSFQEVTPDPLLFIESDKHPIPTAEPEIVDKSVIEEELVVKNEMKSISAEKPNLYAAEDDDDKEVEEWLEDMEHVSSKAGNNNTPVGEDEDVSFSDLEDDDDD